MNKWRPGLLLCVVVVLGATYAPLRAAAWQNFYQTSVKPNFTLPAEMQIVEWRHQQAFPMGEDLVVRFRLPATKSPEQWLDLIAEKSAMLNSRRGQFYFIAGDRQLRYNPNASIYEVSYSF